MNDSIDLVDGACRGEPGARRALHTWFASASHADRSEVLDHLAATAAGQRLALEVLVELVHRYKIALPAITTILIDQADVDDAAQLTLIAVAEQIHGFEGRSRFQTWVRAIARNEALQVLRRKRRKTEPTGEEVPEHDAFVRRLSSVVADQHAVKQALDQLSEPFREALILREIDQLDYGEISRRLGLPLGTVRSRIARARQQLAELAWHW